MLPSIEPSEVGWTGLLWLFLSYGYVLYYASNLIGEGSELLLLVPSMAGLVGGVVLPLLGAVPDGAIILFSGLGDLETAQETLSVGVGALAGSTIMLLTIPFAISVISGRVDIKEDGTTNYLRKPKLSSHSFRESLTRTGVSLTEAVQHGGTVMVLTTVPYFLIQVPAMFIHGPADEVAAGEHWWALAGLLVCLIGLVAYMKLQLSISRQGEDKGKRVAVIKKLLKKGEVSLAGALTASIRSREERLAISAAGEYQAVGDVGDAKVPPPAVAEYLKEVLAEAFMTYDKDKSGHLDKLESFTFFRDFHENIVEEEMDRLFGLYDTDNSGLIDFDEFIAMSYNLITAHEQFVKREEVGTVGESVRSQAPTDAVATEQMVKNIWATETEEEEVPEEFTELSPEEQQVAIKKKAFVMLSIGTLLVVLFSDPMVDVMQEIAVRIDMSPFYVSFILAPLASNASEVLASQYYAAKKTRKTITVSLTALEGAAAMNNTFCLSIFMGLVFFRGLAWQYTAETISIIVVEFIMGYLVQSEIMDLKRAIIVMLIFPLSLVLVAVLEAFGLD